MICLQAEEESFIMGNEQSTSIDLPPITVRGEYVINVTSRAKQTGAYADQGHLEPSIMNSFLRSVVDVGHLEQSLTTDLLNQLIFLQKGFIKASLP